MQTFNKRLIFKKNCSSKFGNQNKMCNAKITVPKNFYMGDETAYFNLSIDNS